MEPPIRTNVGSTIESAAHIPIAQLTPLLAAPSSRSIKAIVTLTWPYSSATGSVAFLLSEPDFRLRRTRGQVRVQFAGSSAKQITKSGIASGDEVVLCLEGAEWIQDENKMSTPGRGVEFELKFTERLLLQFRPESSRDVQFVDIDHPELESAEDPEVIIPPKTSTTAPPATNGHTSSIPADTDQKDNEFLSPAFLKRARTSYGSVFEGFDPFDEADGTVRGKGRKRTRLSDVKRWQYSSRSPTPEPEESTAVTPVPSPTPVVQSRPMMTDEGCQTMDLETDDAAEALADLSRQAVNVAGISYARVDEPINPGIQIQVPAVHEMSPPIIHTSFPQAEIQPISERVAPISPRLRPQPSELLPLVSPLVSKSLFGFSGPVTPASLPGHNRNPTELLPAPIEDSVPPTEVSEEDIYSASPKHRDEAEPTDFSSFTNPLTDANGFIPINVEERFGFEDQHGQWQGDNANLRHTPSPPKQPDSQEHLGDIIEDERSYVEEGRDARQFLDHNVPHDQEPNHSHYPDLDELSDHPITVWGDHSVVAYPDLPEPENGMGDNYRTNTPPPHSTPMSRIGSQQSQAIDLIESSDEGEEQENEEVALGYASNVEESDGSMASEEEEEQEAGYLHSQYFPQNDARVPQESYKDEESYDEDEFEADENDDYIYAPGANGDPGDYYEDEESEMEGEGYDDDVENEPPQRPSVSQAPVFIDLLSSDDEDVGAMPAPQPRVPIPQQAAPEPDSDEDIEDNINDTRRAEELDLGSNRHERQGSYHTSDEESDFGDEAKGRQETRDIKELESEGDERSHNSESESKAALSEEKENVILQLDEEPTTMDEDIPDDNFPELHKRQSSAAPISPILHPREFGLDGSNDENIAEEPANTASKRGEDSMEPETLRTTNSAQLLTPDDTQRSEKIFSAETSFATSQEVHARATESQNTSFTASSDITENNIEVRIEISETIMENRDIDQTAPAAAATLEDVARSEEAVIEDQEDIVEETTRENLVVEREDAVEDTPMEGTSGKETTVEESTNEFTEKATVTHEIIQEVLEPQQFVEESALPSPRRSSRLVKSTILEPKENVRPSTPVKSAIGNTQDSSQSDRSVPMVVIDDKLSSPQGHDASVELALASHDSPIKKHDLRRSSVASIDLPSKQHNLRSTPAVEDVPQSTHNLRNSANENETPPKYDLRKHPETDTPTKGHDLRKAPVADLKLKLSRALRTELSEFTALKVLRYHINLKLDVLAVATIPSTEPQRGKGTSRQFLTTFNIIDVSIAPSTVTEIQVFRPYKDALPIIQAGDGVLLRNFQVISVKNKGFALRSDDASSWAVFKDDEEPEIRGPPVELGAGEKKHIGLLKKWYGDLDATMMAKLNRANAEKANAA